MADRARLANLDVATLRELLRHYAAWRAVYETDGIDEITDAQGRTFSLWDVQYLVEQLHLLPLQQRRAIELCLLQNVKERQAAVLMGVSVTNPVGMYATLGLEKLVEMVRRGHLPRYRMEGEASRWQPSE